MFTVVVKVNMCCDHIGCSSVGWSVDPVIDKSDIDAEDMDCTGEPFAHGHAYVAFSRVSDCDNIRVIVISECQLLACTGELLGASPIFLSGAFSVHLRQNCSLFRKLPAYCRSKGRYVPRPYWLLFCWMVGGSSH
jgi:hypothetical protein